MDVRSSWFVKSSWRSLSSLSSPPPSPPPGSSSLWSSPPPGSDEDKRSSVYVPKWVDPFEGIEIDPYKAVSKVEEEEGRYVITFTVGTGISGKPIEGVEYVAKKPPVSSIERDLRLLNLSSSSSSYDSLSPPPPQFPFPWAAADDSIGGVKILSFDEITSKLGIMEIRGEVECTNCHQSGTIGFDIKTQCSRIYPYVQCSSMGGFFRCEHWINPILKTPCPSCGGTTGRLKPVIPDNDIDYRKINWLFLFLDQMLGFCSVEQLNLFCKHSSTRDCVYREYCGAKKHLLYLTYVTLCNQLFPTGPLNDPKRIL